MKPMYPGDPFFYQWPEIFTDEKFKYKEKDKERLKKMALADGLCGWGICMASNNGNPLPDNFGIAMIKIGTIVGITPTPEKLMKMARGLK